MFSEKQGFISSRNTTGNFTLLIDTRIGGAYTITTSTQFTFGGVGSYTINWGDGNTQTLSGIQTHTYPNPGVYEVSVIGPIQQFRSANNTAVLDTDAGKILNVVEWGNNGWSTGAFMFTYCENLQITATDIPNFSTATSLAFMFYNCQKLSTANNIGSWNTGNVANLRLTFGYCHQFNSNINSWNVSKVITLNNTFAYCYNFNQPLNSWNTANVGNLGATFYSCTNFNQPLNSWNTSNVTNMNSTFSQAANFNQSINSWNVSNCTNFGDMFSSAYNFNQSLTGWSLSTTTNCNAVAMFAGATSFNQNIDSIGLTKISNSYRMFNGASSFNQVISSNILKSNGNISAMLDGSGINTSNYNTILNSWKSKVQTDGGPYLLILGASGLTYTSAAVASRNYLTTARPSGAGWTITGDTLV